MDIFRYSRGHFFGTLLPGAFLLINILFVDPSISEFLFFQGKIDFKDNQSTILIIGFILSYVIGIALRLLSPDFLEKIALIIKAPTSAIQLIYSKLSKQKSDITFKQRLNIFKQAYPYSDWFFNFYLPNSTKQHQDFFNIEFENDKQKLKKIFILGCKTFIYDSSGGLSEEIMYTEGLVRFICGIIYSLLFVLILMLFHFSNMKEIFFVYLIIFFVFLSRLRGIRIKEVLTILDGYMFLKTKK
ncbi:MAG: hypothetical protein WC839_04215 [Candidatus Paceibacterota bacterium]